MTLPRAISTARGPEIALRPEHLLSEADLVTLIAVAYGVHIGTATASPSPRELEHGIRMVLWESGNDFRERLAIEHDAEDRLAFGREMVARHFTHLFPKETPR